VRLFRRLWWLNHRRFAILGLLMSFRFLDMEFRKGGHLSPEPPPGHARSDTTLTTSAPTAEDVRRQFCPAAEETLGASPVQKPPSRLVSQWPGG